MTAVAAPAFGDRRLLTFEVDGSVFALPIAVVLEVAEADRICCVPSVPASRGGVMNWHGDALPVVAPGRLLFAGEPDDDAEDGAPSELVAEHVLVMSDPSGQSARLGLPIDRVLGLVEGGDAPARGRALVVERRSVDGRVVSVLDPGQLVVRAIEEIEQSVH